MMGVEQKLFRYGFFQRQLNLQRVFAGRKPGAVRNAEDMSVDRHGRRAEGDVHHHIGGFASDAGEFFKLVAVLRDLAAEIVE